MFTATEKLAAIRRELKYRAYVYPRLINEGKITDGFASTQIAIFVEIAADYQQLAEKERLI